MRVIMVSLFFAVPEPEGKFKDLTPEELEIRTIETLQGSDSMALVSFGFGSGAREVARVTVQEPDFRLNTADLIDEELQPFVDWQETADCEAIQAAVNQGFHLANTPKVR